MVIGFEFRGFVEQAIEAAISHAKVALDVFRQPEIKKNALLKDEHDFALGVAWGMTLKAASAYMVMTKGRNLDDEEFAETVRILNERMPKIREELFKEG